MAKRSVFVASSKYPFYEVKDVEFTWVSGLNISQDRKRVDNLHSSYKRNNPNAKLLEVSSVSTIEAGVSLSAFNLKVDISENLKNVSIESAFQGSKVFGDAHKTIREAYTMPSREAKALAKAIMEEEKKLVSFNLNGLEFPLDPKDYFYNWIYINAVSQHKELSDELIKYDAFTDIKFNPQKSINCQAKAAAIYKGLSDAGLLEKALDSKENFLKVVYDY